VTRISIHQPNYLPWLGFFAKLARSDVLVLLDDVQFSKGSFTNRVRIGGAGGGPRWLTVPVRHAFGATISDVELARPDWARAHREILLARYRRTAGFAAVWPEIESFLLSPLPDRIAPMNEMFIRLAAGRLGLPGRIVRASEIGVPLRESPERRLAEIVARLAPAGTYLSGAGGAKYQDPQVFAEAGIALEYVGFSPMPYPTGDIPFEPGLSVLDAVFHAGWDFCADLLKS
jgi:hypothetical protein